MTIIAQALESNTVRIHMMCTKNIENSSDVSRLWRGCTRHLSFQQIFCPLNKQEFTINRQLFRQYCPNQI